MKNLLFSFVRDGGPNFIWLGPKALGAIFCCESKIMKIFEIGGKSGGITPIGFLLFTHCTYIMFLKLLVAFLYSSLK